MSRSFARAKKVLEKAGRVRIVGKETDLSFSIKGRTAIPCAGEFNMPDGEIFTAPVETSTEGKIFEFPAIAGGARWGIRLTFRKGRVVEASAGEERRVPEGRCSPPTGARPCSASSASGRTPGDLLHPRHPPRREDGGDDPPGGRPFVSRIGGRTTRRSTGT